MRNKIALDLDGVLYDWGISLYNELFIHDKVSCSYEEFWSNTDKYNSMWWDNMTKVPFLYGTQIPKEGVLKLLEDLSKTYDIYYITARPKEAELATTQYLKKYEFPQREHLIFTHSKAEACASLGITLMVEDQPKYIDALLSNGIEVVIHNQVWNMNHVSQCKRIHTFTELRSILC